MPRALESVAAPRDLSVEARISCVDANARMKCLFIYAAVLIFIGELDGNCNVTLPTPNERNGDFSDPRILTGAQAVDPVTKQAIFDALGRPIFVGEIFNPATTTIILITSKSSSSNSNLFLIMLFDPFNFVSRPFFYHYLN